MQDVPPSPLVRRRLALTRLMLLLPPDLTLPMARRWLSSPNWHLSHVADDLMEEHATREEFPLISAALSEHLQMSSRNIDTYRTCSLLDIMARFADVGPNTEAERVFIEARYSFARMRAARALSINAPAYFAEHYAFECLYDCEAPTRELACSHVPLTHPGVLARLRALTEDPQEEDPVKREALTRLEASAE
jgi:hypothetical protein